MKKLINILSILSAIVTSILIICTFATLYQFFYVGQIFNSYMPIQVGAAVTMGFLSVRFWISENGNRKFIYSLLSLSISVILFFSMTVIK
ncbi:hypothetical protein ACQPU1_14525 [Clostridium paraputrificum]|uniref:hypothetical protein n=1 Tax=Clostridium TaxID=1485 RepID=UPI003D346D8E